ncbi:MAG TPA: EAL domain-containing protein [Steroidobacteraceae bacterium]|nr:EAL domain-containing protein [Steroidobacteraceae bacterium]
MQGNYTTWIVNVSIALAIIASYVAMRFAARVTQARGSAAVAVVIAGAILMGTASWVLFSSFAPFAGSSNDATRSVLPFALGVMEATAVIAFVELWLRDRKSRNHEAHTVAHALQRFDTLTGLPDRATLASEAHTALADAQRHATQLAVLVLNVDRLKPINDSLGHHVGDELLLDLSRRLRDVLRRNDTLARLAGDEFTILATDLRGPRDAETIATKVLDALQRPFQADSVSVHPSISIGISMFPLDGDTFPKLLSRANAAMRYTKAAGRGTFRFYADEMSRISDDQLTLENELREALERNQLELHYQPKVDIATGRVRSAEALIRWRHPVRGLVPPNVFIPVAEETGLILPIGEWVLRQACRQMRAWLDSGMSPVRIAVNLSAKQFHDADLALVVRSALNDAQLEPGFIELELTESALMNDPEQSAATLQSLSAMGVHISIDDFGTGYSSLSYLRRFPLDKLKIDRSFIRDLMTNADDVCIVRAIISLAHSLRLRVVAEGVETAQQLEFLRELGCDQYQGFFCSPAVPAEAFAALITRIRAEKPDLTEADMLRTQSRLSAFTPETTA